MNIVDVIQLIELARSGKHGGQFFNLFGFYMFVRTFLNQITLIKNLFPLNYDNSAHTRLTD